MLLYPILLSFISSTFAFECFTCNNHPRNDDSMPCVDKLTTCPGGSCSMAVRMRNGKMHVRKFCSTQSTPIYQYLMLLPGSNMCQNIHLPSPPEFVSEYNHLRSKRETLPPAPQHSSSLLCVCSTPQCNKGTYREVLEHTMLNNLPNQLLRPQEEEKKTFESIHDHPDMGIQQQMADAGF